MKHLLFFYLALSCVSGFFSLAILVLAYFKSRWKALKYFICFLLSGTLQLVWLTYVEYCYANFSIWFRNDYGVICYGLESLTIIILPLLVQELFVPSQRRRAGYLFGFLFLSGLLCLLVPFFAGVLIPGTLIETLLSYKVYRLIYGGVFLYSLTVFMLKINNISDAKEKNFYIGAMAILTILTVQTFFPVIKNFPESLFIFGSGYFYINVLLIHYTVNRFLKFPNTTSQETVDGLVTNREKEILALVLQGLANKDIGVQLCISEPTVKSHIQNIYKKLGVKNRIQLINSLKNLIK